MIVLVSNGIIDSEFADKQFASLVGATINVCMLCSNLTPFQLI